eukprot:gene11123-12294_t
MELPGFHVNQGTFLRRISNFRSPHALVVSLRIVPKSKHLMQRKVAANFPFDPPLQVEAIDDCSQRITSGVYSNLNISAQLTNNSGCLSVDSDFQLYSGLGTFPGSICSPILQIAINFTATWNGTTFWSDSTPLLDVTGHIHVAHFYNQLSKEREELNAFLFGAVADVNEGIMRRHSGQLLLPGRTIYLRNFIHGGSSNKAIDAYLEMKKIAKLDPASKPHAVLGFGNNEASDMLLPVSMLDDLSVLSYTDDDMVKFSDKDKYPYFNRLGYSKKSIYHGFVLFLLERKWKDIVLIQSRDNMLDKEFFNICSKYRINILYQFTCPVVKKFNSEPIGRFKHHFTNIASIGTRIIVTIVKKPTSFYLFSEALSQNITGKHGYQWIGLGTEDDFPHGNEPIRCQNLSNLCNFAFKGLIFVSSFHPINGYNTPQWHKTWKSYLDVSASQEREMSVELWKRGSAFALAYDSVLLYAASFQSLIEANRTITGPLLSTSVRSVTNLDGLLQNVSLSPTGDPTKYFARLSFVWPNEDIWKRFLEEKVNAGVLQPWDWSLDRPYGNPTTGYYIVESAHSNTTVELKSDGGSNMLYIVDWLKDESLKTGYIAVDSQYKNLRRFRSAKGLFSLDEQKLVAEDWSFEKRESRKDVVYEEVERTEHVPAAFFCINGCGGNQTNSEDIHIYEHGICTRHNVCTCSVDVNGTEIWAGKSCETPVCGQGCVNGNCTRPNVCECHSGWIGSDCHTPTCTNSSACDSVGGTCFRPNVCICKTGYYGPFCSKKCVCKHGSCRNGLVGDGTCIHCHSGYFGENCDISLYAVIFPVLLAITVFFIMVLSTIKCFVRRSQLKSELQNTDWIVNWSQLKRAGEKESKNIYVKRFSLTEPTRQDKSNFGTWNKTDVYFQRFDRPSLKFSEALRYEIKIVRDMKHDNIINFVGASIMSPNVLILTELAAKGSLDDILANDDIKMPWIFKYSLLKDICRGLDYIHQSEIGSHGRLKSSNCLIDSKWKLKLTGFGLKCFREDQLHVPKRFQSGQEFATKDEFGVEAEYMFFFAIIFSEICNRQLPFCNVNMSSTEIINMIAEGGNPFLQRIWNTFLASMNMEAGRPVRPCIPKSNWPDGKEESRSLQLLINKCWTKDPSLRPIAKDVLKTLEKIDPDGGESMEKLVSMLEKYSNNLEDVVTARAQALAEEKRKTEELVARLLPRPVVEDLKLGKPVEAEKFECVTICMSELCDFTEISEASTAAQTIGFLNDVYACFDSILLKFDAIRIETIGNTYMVVSGLPIRNGKKHASEIALFSIALIDAVENFRIDHLPSERLQIQIGIHSGGVAAGVVGLKLPRYCVFGDTVHVASILQSSQKPMRIQISDATISLIDDAKLFNSSYYEHQDIQGVGRLKVWSLTGSEMRQLCQSKEERGV